MVSTFSLLYLLQTKPISSSTPDWGMFGVVIGIISILTAISISIFQIKATERPKKQIKCLVISNIPLLKFDDRFKSHLQVSFHGMIVQDATAITLRIYNSGKLSITPTDFTRPIKFIFGSSTEIITAEILETDPANIGAIISVSKNTIELQPLLMNSGDSVDISTIVTSFDKNITIDGRIVDIKTIKLIDRETEKETINFKLKYLQIALMIASVFLTMLPSFLSIDSINNIVNIIIKK